MGYFTLTKSLVESKAPVSQPVNNKCSAHRRLVFKRTFFTKRCRNVVKKKNLNLDMFLVDLVEETLEFVEASLYQLLTPTIRLQNLCERATQCTVCLNYKYGSLL